jgi:hypothetical protein
MGQWLSERLGQQFIIDNRPGAGRGGQAVFPTNSIADRQHHQIGMKILPLIRSLRWREAGRVPFHSAACGGIQLV